MGVIILNYYRNLHIAAAALAVFMLLCGLLCGGIKYAEVVSASCSRIRMNGVFVGGAMYSLKTDGHKTAALIFSVCGILASFGTGNMTQASAVGDVMAANGIPRTLSAALLALLVAFAVFGGQKRIRLTGISGNDSQARIELLPSAEEEAQVAVTASVSTKPFIYLLWIGAVAASVGCFVAMRR